MKLHGKPGWGTFLDAGTGSHSLSWVVGIKIIIYFLNLFYFTNYFTFVL